MQSKGLSRVFSKEGERVEKGRNKGKETGKTVCRLTTSKTGQGSNDTANPLFYITDEFNTEFYKLTLSKILIDHVLQRFDFSGEKTEVQRRLLPWVSHSIRDSRFIYHLPKQFTLPSGQGCHGLPESEGLSSGGGRSQRSAAVGCWVSLWSYLSLDFPV